MVALLLSLTLAAAPAKAPPGPKVTQLVLEVKPATVVIFLDGKKLGTAHKVWTVKTKPGNHKLKLQARISSQEEVISVKAGETKVWKFDLRDSGEKANDPTEAKPTEDSKEPAPTPPAPSTLDDGPFQDAPSKKQAAPAPSSGEAAPLDPK